MSYPVLSFRSALFATLFFIEASELAVNPVPFNRESTRMDTNVYGNWTTKFYL